MRSNNKRTLVMGRRCGCLREVVTDHDKGHVTSVNYLTPAHPVTSARARLKSRNDVESSLKKRGSHDISLQAGEGGEDVGEIDWQ